MRSNSLKALVLTLVIAGFACLQVKAQTSLIATGSVWKYLDDGTDQGSAWRGTNYDDTAWLSGPAELGYGEGDEGTTLTATNALGGTNITFYFRYTLVLADTASMSNALLQLKRDDGGIVYVNDTEVFRSNMPTGAVFYTNVALGAVADDGQTFQPKEVPVGLLRDGTNVIAVEIHQSAITSSDVSFDFELLVNYIPIAPEVAISSPADNAVIVGSNVTLVATATDVDGTITKVEFYQASVLIGEDTTAPFSLLVTNLAPGFYTFYARATDGAGLFTDSDAIFVQTIPPPPSTIIARASVWKYHNLGQDLLTAWTNLTFDDGSWASGPGPLGDNNVTAANPSITIIGIGPTGARFPTVYFRKTVTIANPTLYGGLSVSVQKDDGAVVYINGVEAIRTGMADAPTEILFGTFATFTADDAAEPIYNPFTIPSSYLVAGSNVIAVEVHNVGAGSSDLQFDLEMVGLIAPSVAITSPADGAMVNVPVSFDLEATAMDSDGVVTQVEFFNGLEPLGADTTSPYSVNVTNLSEGAYVFTAVATDNTGATATSAPITVNVLDPNPPALVAATGTTNTVTVVFSKRVVEPSATASSNYTVSGSLVTSAAYGLNSNTVILTTTALSPGVMYTLTVNNVRDSSANPIAPNSQIMFEVVGFVNAAVGNPAVPGSVTIGGNGYDVTGAGTDIGGTADQFRFNYESSQRTGDFDVKVRLDGFVGNDSWAKAGLMARESLLGNSRHAGAFATPSISGCFLQSRATTGGATTQTGYSPVTYPNTWLRLRRVGNVFTGYSSPDGETWATLGSVTIAMPANVYVGMAVTSRSPGQTATGRFRDFGTTVGGTIGSLAISKEPLGPSSRKTGLVISEIMYNPRTVPGFSNSLEFVEIFNSQAFFENIGGYRLSGAMEYTFPANTVMQPGAFLVVAREPSFVQSHYGIAGVLGPWVGAATNGLPGDAGRVRLRGRAGAVLLEVNYEDHSPWPIAADGAGHSLVLARPSYGEGSVKAWAASDSIDGSPGKADPFAADAMRNVVINEFLAHTDDPLQDYIELYNHANSPVNISGAWLTDEADTNKYRIPNNTSIPARGFVSFNQTTLGFSLSSGGERIFLVNSNQTRVIDALDFEAQQNGVSTGRSPDGSPYFYRMASRTPGAANSGQLYSDIVINEIMFAPISGDTDDEYVELYNRGNAAVNVGLWKFVEGIDFTIPYGTTIASNGYMVIAKKASRLLANYAGLNATNTLGDYDGTLANGGERVALAIPDYNVTTNQNNALITNVLYVVVNEVTYGDGGKWGDWADGGGGSLELRDPWSDNRLSANWGDSDESNKGIWTSIDISGTIGETLSTANDNLQIFMLGIGECLVDDVAVSGSLNTNPGFESDMTGWTPQGSHDFSTIENVGYSGNKSLHLRAASRGDNGANRIRSPVLSPTPSGTVSLRCKAKWIRGWPELLLRLHGGGLEVAGRLRIQPDLGTPGRTNSQLVANVGPAVYDVIHTPILPAANEAVVVTARATDPDSPFTLALKYRVDPSSTYTTVMMKDTGTNEPSGDTIAGDGIYAATIPGQPSGTNVPFYVEGTDSMGGVATFPKQVFPIAPLPRLFPTDAVTHECVVRWGDRLMPGSFGTYRVWLTAGNTARWTSRAPALNNSVLDGTFVYNNFRVIYNMLPSYAGSPWHRGQMDQGPAGGERVDYDIEFPTDDRFMGATDAVWNNPGNPADNNPAAGAIGSTSDTSAQTEQTSYQIFKEIGVHYNHRRYVHVFVNGTQRSTTSQRSGNFIFEDSQQPNGDQIEQYFPDDTDGDLYKIEDWFEFPDDGFNFSANNDADLQRRIHILNGVTNTIHTGAYRFMWRLRNRGTGESATDYSSFYNMLNIVSPTAPTGDPINVAAIDDILDYEQWMRIFAVQHAVGNWDAYGFERGKNAYTYKPQNGKFQQWTWDIDFTVGIGGNAWNTANLFTCNDPRIVVMWNTPAIRRAYARAYLDIVNGPLNSQFMDPILDAKAAALTLNNVNYDAGAVTTIKNYVRDRHHFLRTNIAMNLPVLTNSAFAITGTEVVNVTTNVATISGTASVAIKDLYVNGVLYPVTWTAVNNWTIRVPVAVGSNVLVVTGTDGNGNSVPGANRTNTVVNTGPVVPSPVGIVMINEIMFNPLVPDAEYVELHNTSSIFTFDLSGFRFNGLDYTFPPGSFISPRAYLVLARNRGAFIAAYGSTIAVFDEFKGDLQPDGETLTLVKPGVTAAEDVIIDKVRYESVRPWPVGTNDIRTAASIQVVDAREDNSRPANWSTRYIPAVYSAVIDNPSYTNIGWRYVTYTGTIVGAPSSLGTNFPINHVSAGSSEVFLDDLVLVRGTVAEAGPNMLVNGDFESPFTGPWSALGNHSNSVISSAMSHSGSQSLRLLSSATGSPTTTNHVRQFLPLLPSNTVCTLSFWYFATYGATNVQIRVGSSSFNISTNVQPAIVPPQYTPAQIISPAVLSVTPGTTNTGVTTLAGIPQIWLNEVQSMNVSGILDSQNEREPWIEIYNAATTNVPLAGLYLADNYRDNLLQWQFPIGSSIAPGEFKVIFADGETGDTVGTTELHTNFRLTSSTGFVALVRVSNNTTQILDYLTYSSVGPNLSYGDYRDGQPFNREIFYDVTPRTTNSARTLAVFVNEWMAANSGFLLDTNDNTAADWFELYNPNPGPVDLSGFYLTDTTNDTTQFRIPDGTVISGQGYMLFWADEDHNTQNGPGREVHVNFRLGANPGEAIALYSPLGELVDLVTFGRQTNNISEGRFTDGAAARYFMPTPTPRAANVIPGANTTPSLAAIADKTVTLGQTLTFNAMATDPEAPPQTLTFSLLGAIGNAAIGPVSGTFTWTPGPEHTPGAHVFTVRVTDSGTPQLSADRTFTVNVVPPPIIAVSRPGSGQAELTFPTVAGRHYRIEFTDNLALPIAWQTLTPPGNNVLAAGSSMTINDTTLGAATMRYYRVYQLD